MDSLATHKMKTLSFSKNCIYDPGFKEEFFFVFFYVRYGSKQIKEEKNDQFDIKLDISSHQKSP